MTIDTIVIHANAFVSTYFVDPAKRDLFVQRFDALWQADVEGLRQATHFVFYGWGRDENQFVAIESWKDEGAVAAIRQTDLFKQAVHGLLECCVRPMEMHVYSGMAAGRDLFETYPAGPSAVHPAAGEIGAVFR